MSTIDPLRASSQRISEELLAAHERGESVSAMASEHGLRREAIATELAKHGIGAPSPGTGGGAGVRPAQPRSVGRRPRLRLDLSKSSVSRYLRGTPRAPAGGLAARRAPTQKFTDAQMADALKAAFRQLDDRSKGLSRKRYRELMEDEDVPGRGDVHPSLRDLVGGVSVGRGRRRPRPVGTNYVQDWSNDDIVAAVVEFIDDHRVDRYHAYAAWARENGRPSGPLLVQRLGGWADARQLAIKATRSWPPDGR